MTTYNGSRMAAGVQPRVLPSGYGVTVLSTFAMPVGTPFLTNDLLNMLNIEGDAAEANPGPFITGVALDSDQIDTGAGVIMAVGDSGAAARYITGSNVGQAGGFTGPNVGGTLNYQPFATTYNTYTTASLQLYTMVIKFTTGVTTPKAGTVRLKAEYTYDP